MSIINKVSEFLQQEGCDVVVLREGVAIRTGLEGENGEWTCDIELVDMSDEVQILGVMSYAGDGSDESDVVPPEHIAAGIMLANHVNFDSMLLGNFEIDPSDGNWRLRTSMAFNKEDGFSEDSMRHICFVNWMEMDYYFPLFAQVLFDGTDLDTAITAWNEDDDDDSSEEE